MRWAPRLSLVLALAACAGAREGESEGEGVAPPVPVLITLEVTPETIVAGDKAILNWTAKNVVSLSLTQNGADLPMDTTSLTSGSLRVGPGVTTEYVLSGQGAAGATGEARATLTVEAAAEGEDSAPTIKEFTASPESVGRDDEVLLSWNVADADTVSLTAGGQAVELDDPAAAVGSARHTPGVSITYRLTAVNAHGQVAADAHVTVPLAILEAAVAAERVAPGDDAVVSFRVQSADSVTLTTDREGDEAVEAEFDAEGRGEVTVAGVTGRTGLTLTAVAGEESVRWTGEVGINVPEIGAFEASEDSVGIDDDVELSWRIEGADSVEITATPVGGEPRPVDLQGARPGEGAATDRPGDTTTYELVATGREGEARAELTVTVPTAVVELTLVGSPAVLGGDVTAAYRVQGADEVTVTFGDREALVGAIDEAGRGTVEIEGVRQAGTVTVTATRGDESADRQAEVTLAAPAILAFETSADVAGADAPARLSWDVLGAESLTLSAEPRVGFIYEIDIEGQGVRRGGANVSPFLATTYTLTATNSAGEVSEQVSVDVQPNILRFEAAPSPVPYGGDATVHFRVHGVTTVTIDDEEVQFDAEGRGTYPLLAVTEPRVLRLEAIGPDDSTGQELEVRPAPPRVISFAVAPEEAGIDDEVVVSWEIEGATELSIEATPAVGEPYLLDLGDEPEAAGEVRLTPRHSTDFALLAGNPQGQAEARADVLVPLQVLELELSGSPAVLGDSVTLRTRIQGAVLVEVIAGDRPSVELDLDGEGRAELVIDDVREDMDLLLEAFDHDGAVTSRDLQVELRLPEIASFTADPVQGGADVDVRLVWDARGVAELELSATPEGGEALEIGLPQGLPGEVTVRPTVTTEYELLARNAAGETTARLNLPVPLAFLEFEVAGSPVVPGGTVTVRYRVQGAVRVEAAIDDGDRAGQPLGGDGRGEFELADVQAAFQLTVVATDGGGREVTREADVGLAGPTIGSFDAEPETVHPGQAATLSWATDRADAVRVETLDGDGGVVDATEYQGDDVAQGSHVTEGIVQATRFRLVARGAGDVEESAELTVGVVRDPTALRLSEVFYDADSGDGGHEWIELHNSGDNPINLADVIIGNGGGSFARNVDPLPELVVPAGGCVVVGGPVVDERSFADAYDVELDFSPDLQNSGDAADGVALFAAADAPIADDTAPFDAVLYGPAVDVDDTFTGPDGQPLAAPDVHDVDPASSIVRVVDGHADGQGGGAWFEAKIGPTPGRCFGLAPEDFADGDNQLYLGRRRGAEFGGDLLGLRTFGLSAAAPGTTLTFGDAAGTCFDDPQGIFCLMPPGTGVVDLTITAAGGDVVYPAFYSYEKINLCSIVGFDLDSVVTGEEYVGTVLVDTPGDLTFEDLAVESGWGPEGTDPSLTPDLWTWTAITHLRTEEDGDDTFEGPATAPDEAGTYLRTFRAAPTTDGVPGVYTYCADSPLVYSPELLDTFTVTEPVPQ